MEIIRPGTNFNIVGRRSLFGAISAALVFISLLLIVVVKPNYGIDFEGGTNIIVRFSESVDLADITGAMRDLGFDDAVVQQFGMSGEHQFLIETNRISVITEAQADQIRQTLQDAFGTEDFLFTYNAESGDRIEIKAPQTAFEPPAEPEPTEPGVAPPEEGIDEGTSMGTGEGTGEASQPAATPLPSTREGAGAGELSTEEAYITDILVGAGLQNAQVSQIGNPRHRRFLIRLQEIQGRVEEGLVERFGEEAIPIEGLNVAVGETLETSQMTESLQALDIDEAFVQRLEPYGENRFLVRASRTGLMSSEQASTIEESLRQTFDVEDITRRQRSVQRVETVGPRVGTHLRNQGIKAAILALFFILVYIGLRFNMRFAPGAVVALFHDVIITIGIFVVLQEEITLTVLAAILTIIGYSLNDTIVVFDRIRENMGTLRTKELPDLVNQSINETLSRTLLTSITTLLVVICIYFIAGGLIKTFALAMIIGIVVGTYSSIYVASPVMMFIHNRLEARIARQRETGRVRKTTRRKKT